MKPIFSEIKNLIRFGFVLVAVLIIFLAALSINAFRQTALIGKATPPPATISFSGHGEVLAKPDIAEVTFTITKEAGTVAAAQDAATKQTNDSLVAMKTLGIDDADIKTVGYNIFPRYEYPQAATICNTYPCPSGTRVLKGYNVSQTIQVKIRDITKAGDVLAKLGGLGVTDIGGLSFMIEDDTSVKGEAREKAIADAKAQAEATAKDLGVKLGRIINFSESSPMMYFNKAYGAGEMSVSAAAPSIPAGENTVTSDVTITYSL